MSIAQSAGEENVKNAAIDLLPLKKWKKDR
jgi:hypothetical protein